MAEHAVPGRWVGDLLLGRRWTRLATLVERTARFTVLVRLAGRDTHAVTAGLPREMAGPPEHVRRSLTWDRGMKLARRAAVTANTGRDMYLADPLQPVAARHQREHQPPAAAALPEGRAHEGPHASPELNHVAARLNARPRKTLDFETPPARFEALLR